MKRELQKVLVKKYYVFFDWLNDTDPNGSIHPMSFGFECGDGWFWLLDNLMNAIYFYQKNNKHLRENEQYIRVTQIKEKWGGLCFYYNGGDNTIYGMVRLAESMSYKICEQCGTTENIGRTTRGWIAVRCKSCCEKDNRLKNYNWKPNDNNKLLKLLKIKELLTKN